MAEGPKTNEQLAQEADVLFKEGVKQVLKDASEAVVKLGQCLEIRNKLHGNEAVECAETYYHYGRALLEQARESTDALGSSKVCEDMSKKEEADKRAAAGGAGPSSSASAAKTGEEAQKGEDGDNSEVAEDEAQASEGKVEEKDEEEEQEQEGEDDGDDLSLAWEMLELARAIYVEDGADKHLSPLADVHLRLGDLNAEKEDFGTAIAEYEQCIAYITRLPEGPGTGKQRRLAEVHFDMLIPLQFDDRVQEALSHCRSAQKLMQVVQNELTAKLDTPVENETEEEADEEIERLESELENIKGILAELKEKEEELVKCSEQNTNMKDMLKSLLQNLAKTEGATTSSGAAAGPSTAAAPGASANPMERGFAPLGGGRAPAGPVRHMGVVGRGRARITLQPQAPIQAALQQQGAHPAEHQGAQQQGQQPQVGQQVGPHQGQERQQQKQAALQPSLQLPSASNGAQHAQHGTGTQQAQQQRQSDSNGAAPQANKRRLDDLMGGGNGNGVSVPIGNGNSKRRLEDLMGGGGGASALGKGTTSVGFGGSQSSSLCVKQAPVCVKQVPVPAAKEDQDQQVGQQQQQQQQQ